MNDFRMQFRVKYWHCVETGWWMFAMRFACVSLMEHGEGKVR